MERTRVPSMIEAMVPATKGLSFNNIILFTRERFGPQGWDALLERMSRDDQQVLTSMVPVGWYDLRLYARVVNQMVELYGHGKLDVVEDYGRFSAERDIGTFYKLLFRITSPGLIFDQAMKLWDRIQNTGVWQVQRGDHRAIGTLSNWGCVDAALCRELVGYMEAMLAHGNCKRVKVEHPSCRVRGAPACVFTGVWQ